MNKLYIILMYFGDCYYDGKGVPKDYAEATKWYSKAAEQGISGPQSLVSTKNR